MEPPLFKIDNLTCAYKRGGDVLRIHDIEIPRQKFVILLGKSGSGKSTFLETIGLMNNTMKEGDVHFTPDPGTPPFSLKEFWKKGKEAELAALRREHFSFIFQNTNLMKNFTAHENACLSQMIQGASFATAMQQVKANMQELDLGEIPEWKNASELSGGQRQRIAFVRAITPGFTVLFGDEPTGNLDEFNSKDLMDRLHKNTVEHRKSVIIVSHNIILSVKYADFIILLENPPGNHSPVTVSQRNILRKDSRNGNWKDNQENIIADIQTTVTSRLYN